MDILEFSNEYGVTEQCVRLWVRTGKLAVSGAGEVCVPEGRRLRTRLTVVGGGGGLREAPRSVAGVTRATLCAWKRAGVVTESEGVLRCAEGWHFESRVRID